MYCSASTRVETDAEQKTEFSRQFSDFAAIFAADRGNTAQNEPAISFECRRTALQEHKFQIGQTVYFTSRPIGHMVANSTYQVVKLLPPTAPFTNIASKMRMRRSSGWPGKASSNLPAELAERIRQTGSGPFARGRARAKRANLSRGEALRVCLARAVMANPPRDPRGWPPPPP